jgi:hypothetical protein
MAVCIALVSCQGSNDQGTTTEWIQLFNGKDLEGWTVKIRNYPVAENFGNTFRVEDGYLTVGYEAYDTFNEQFGHIFYNEKFSWYILGLEYRFIGDQVNEGPDWAFRNSGAMLHGQAPETMGLHQDFPISIEVQLLGGNGQDERSTANLCTPGTHVVMDSTLITDHCINSRSKTYHGDQWVRVDIIVLGDSLIQHVIEGETVLAYTRPQIGGEHVSGHDPAVKKDGTLLSEGYISLQSESHPIQFRKVELLDLTPVKDDPANLKTMLEKVVKR